MLFTPRSSNEYFQGETRMKKNVGLYLIILFTGILAFLAGCKDIEIQSTWRNRTVTIDGSDEEWKDLLMYHEKSKIAFASCNDDTDLYLIMVIGDRDEQRRIMMSGFTIYLDETGGSDESFGVRFPLGMKGGPMSTSHDRSEMQNKMKDFSKDTQKELFSDRLGTEMEIIGPSDNETNRMSISGGKGIQLRVARALDNLIYEMKIALKRTVDTPYGINANTGSAIGVGFFVNEIESSSGGGPPGSGMGGGPPGGGMGGGPPGGGSPGGGMSDGPSGGGPQGGGAGRGSNQQQSQGTIDIWATLQLATPVVVHK
jgi:hypothetical protein